MSRVPVLFVISAIIAILSGCINHPKEIAVCGDDKVMIIDKSASDSTNVKVIWQWTVSDAADLPAAYQKYLVPTDECKPVDYNSKILITSSGGGVVLIDRETKKPLFFAHVPNAHSGELLPGGRIVVALSTANGGNCIQLFRAVQRDSTHTLSDFKNNRFIFPGPAHISLPIIPTALISRENDITIWVLTLSCFFGLVIVSLY